jgi:hypothetical protein
VNPLRQVVWPIPTPPINPLLWGNDEHLGWAEAYRPKGYAGSPYDVKAWDAFIQNQEDDQKKREP